MTYKIDLIPALSDRYIFIVIYQKTKQSFVVDPAEAKPVLEYIKHYNLTLDYILCTHHHADHIGGNIDLKQATNAIIYGNIEDASRISAIDVKVFDNQKINLLDLDINIFNIYGHTIGHIAFYIEVLKAAFVGDTLFSLGCGRLFEGTPKQMWESLQKIRSLPKDTYIYAAHEYTMSNAKFALNLLPNHKALLKRYEKIQLQRQMNLPTIPFVLKDDIETNPFLRADKIDVQQAINFKGDNIAECFAIIRQMKDVF